MSLGPAGSAGPSSDPGHRGRSLARSSPGGSSPARTAAAPQEPDVRVLTLAPGVRAAFTGRRGGLSLPPYDSLNMGAGSGDSPETVARNRGLVAAACGLDPARVIWMRQVHGATVARVHDPAAPAIETAATGTAADGTAADGTAAVPAPPRDASFTTVAGLALGVLSADCHAVLIADPEAGMIGAAHSGREGTALGVVPALVRAMTAAGADPARMRALIGPGICGGCYEVPEDMRDAVAAAVPGSGCVTRAGTPGLDVRAGVAAQLAAAGVRQVQADGRCTAEDRDLYSYRRDGRTGRFAGLVWLAP